MEILQECRNRWLKPTEIFHLLQNWRQLGLRLGSAPPDLPPSGSTFLFSKKQVKNFRNDGHNWRRGKTAVKENHEKLRIEGVEAIVCYYAYHEEIALFHRRCYWLVSEPDIVLVHYLDTRNLTSTVSSSTNSTSTSIPVPVPVPATTQYDDFSWVATTTSGGTTATAAAAASSSSQLLQSGALFSPVLMEQNQFDPMDTQFTSSDYPTSIPSDDLFAMIEDAVPSLDSHMDTNTATATATVTATSTNANTNSTGETLPAHNQTSRINVSDGYYTDLQYLQNRVQQLESQLQQQQQQQQQSVQQSVQQSQQPQHHSPLLLPVAVPHPILLDLAPCWDFVEGGSKILLTGQGITCNKQWYVRFNSTLVPALYIMDGVVRCTAPQHSIGVVTVVLTDGSNDVNGCSNAVAFEYRIHETSFSDWGSLSIQDVESRVLTYLHPYLEQDAQLRSSNTALQPSYSRTSTLSSSPSSTSTAQQQQQQFQLTRSEMCQRIANLLKSGDIKPRGLDAYQVSLLHYFAYLGHVQTLKVLMEYGASIDEPSAAGTPLHAAVVGGDVESIRYLLDHGATVTCTNSMGLTPLDLARRLERDSVCLMLKQHKNMLRIGSMLDNLTLSTSNYQPEQLHRAAQMIQKAFRKWNKRSSGLESVERDEDDDDEMMQDDANMDQLADDVDVLQAAARSQSRSADSQQRENAAAVKIQQAFRTHLAKSQEEDVRLVDSATRIQQWYRRYRDRQFAAQIRVLHPPAFTGVNMAATRIQTAFRRHRKKREADS